MLFLSMQPRFTAALIEGDKTVELRRTRMHAPPGSQVLLYSSSPVRAVVATAVLERIDTHPVDDLWVRAGPDAAVTKDEFDTYFAGTSDGFGLHLRAITALQRPVPLHELRECLGVEPPQSFRYLTRTQVNVLLVGATPEESRAPKAPWALSSAPAALLCRLSDALTPARCAGEDFLRRLHRVLKPFA